MQQSCAVAFNIWQNYHFPPTLTYVPPNNVIDKAGKLALLAGFPTIRVICRVYQDSEISHNKPNSGYLLGPQDANFNPKAMSNIFSMYASRNGLGANSGANFFSGDEFGSDSEVPELLNLPRITSGNLLDGFSNLMILNGIMAHGIVVHFFHPDDIYDPARRENTWEKTLMAMRRMFVFLDKAGSHLRKLQTCKYIREFKQYIFSKTSLSSENARQLKIEPGDRSYYYLFVDDKFGSPILKNAKIISEIEPGRVYLIKADKNAEISLKE